MYTMFNQVLGFIRNGGLRNNRHVRENGVISPEQLRVRLRGRRVRAVWDAAARALAVARFLDFYVNAGRLDYVGESVTMASLAAALEAADPASAEFFEIAAYGSALLPEFMVQK